MLRLLFLAIPVFIQACTPLTSRNAEVSACLSTAPPQDCFSQPQDAPAGMARLYVFRPDFSVRSNDDEPVLIIDDLHEMKLGRWRYADFDLALGKHHFKLGSGKSGSDIWNMEGEFDVKETGRYYLAIWNSLGAEGGAEPFNPSEGEAVAITVAVGLVTTAITGMTFLVFPRPGMSTADLYEYAKYELVDEQQALELIRECRLSTPVRLQPAIQ